MWTESDQYKDQNRFKTSYKKWPEAYASCFVNLRKLMDFLDSGGTLSNFKAGFFRTEKKGVFRIGQTRTHKTQEMRLYVYPDSEDSILYILTIGTKDGQRKDIEYCHEIAKTIEKRKAETKGETHGEQLRFDV